MIGKVRAYIQQIFEINRYVEDYKRVSSQRAKLSLQILVSCAFIILSVANIIARSYVMLLCTASGCLVNSIFAWIAQKRRNADLCSLSAIVTCSVLFGFFVVYGGNDGFACLWVVLLPLLSMVTMNFVMGLCASAFFQVFLIVVFWTPVRDLLLYRYNEQFCLRFPLFFFVTFLLGLLLAISLLRSEYNERKHLLELEEMTATARLLARTDPLTKLANRRFAYEEFEAKYSAEGQKHCVVMGDIDYFKKVNDTFGHEFGDEVLVVFAEYINQILPQDYLKSRWGGEEFLFAANAPIEEVFTHVEALRKAIAQHEFHFDGALKHITITFGIAEYTNKDGLTDAISSADDRLYLGKKTRKNCTVTEG